MNNITLSDQIAFLFGLLSVARRRQRAIERVAGARPLSQEEIADLEATREEAEYLSEIASSLKTLSEYLTHYPLH
jgi:hypothetical protein